MKSAGVYSGSAGEVDKMLKEKMRAVDQEIDKFKACRTAARYSNTNKKQDDEYWNARKCARLSPVPGTGSDMWRNAGNFFYEYMGVPKDYLPQSAVQHVERVHAGRRQKIKDEVIVQFTNVRIRDMVASYASNLAKYKNSNPPVNFRLEIPDCLRDVFRTLEKYGHTLKDRLGPGLKRHIKFDDQKKTLYMDVCKPTETEWIRVDFDFALEEVQQARGLCASASARARLGSSSSQGSTNGHTSSSLSFASATSEPGWSQPHQPVQQQPTPSQSSQMDTSEGNPGPSCTWSAPNL